MINAQREGCRETSQAAEATVSQALASVLGRLDALLAAAVRAATAVFAAAPTADPFRGLYVSDADAARVVERGVEPLAQRLSFDLPVVDLAAAGPRWRRLANAFDLSAAEIDVVALALAADVDLRYERIFGYLHDDVTRRRPTVDLALQLLCRSFDERLAGRRLFALDAPLVHTGLLRLVPDPAHPEPPAIGHALRLDEGVVDFLLGRETLNRRLASVAYWDHSSPSRPLGAEALAIARRLTRRLEAPSPEDASLHYLLSGPDERQKIDIGRHVAQGLELPLLVIDLEHLTSSEGPFAQAALFAARMARLLDALALWTRGETLGARAEAGANAGRLDAWLAAVDTIASGGALLATAEPRPAWAAAHSHRFVAIDFRTPDAAARQVMWADRLAPRGITLQDDEATLLAEAFRFDGGAIELAVDRAATAARWRDPEQPRLTPSDLFAGARAQATRALPRFASRIEAAYTWEDIVLPADQLQHLRELCGRVRYRRTVLDVWGFGPRLPLGKGVAALFSGPPGTGKTMGAQVIAAALGGLDLYRVEIPAVVSKYIGETEKALEQVFREAQGTSAILFFDEADALFGRRSEVKDAHDRYANIEVSYLLQALEGYDGLTILATNFQHNLDEAFVRRLAFIVNFPYPEEPERRAIWQRCWPAATPLANDLDVDFLARQFKLAGGDIRNAALAAAFAAAADGGRVTMEHVIRGVRREYQKLGRVCAESDFGPYFALMERQSR